MYYVYVLKSLTSGRYYIGSAADIDVRLALHNRGSVRSTKPYRPWKVAYQEYFQSRAEAYRRELEIKSYKGGIQFKALMGRILVQSGEVA